MSRSGRGEHAADAEDVVPDVRVRWQRVDRAEVRDPIAYLEPGWEQVADYALDWATGHARPGSTFDRR